MSLRKRAHDRRNRNRSAAAMLLLCMILPFLGGCYSVGPNYKKPDMPEIPGASTNVAETAAWWKTFQDPLLVEYVEKALKNNFSLASAEARSRQARAKLGIARAQLGPFFDLAGNVDKFDRSDNSTGGNGTLYHAGFDASWELDIFGGNRRTLEGARANLEAVEADSAALRVSIAAETATAYVSLRSFQRRLAIARENLKAQKETLDILESRMEAGLSNELAVHQARYNVASTRAKIPALQAAAASSQTALAVLTGSMPGADLELEPTAIPQTEALQPELLGIPADLLRRRPDVFLAERELAAQTARIGASTADLYPKLSLTGSIGLESLEFGSFFESGSKYNSIVPGLTWPIFHSGSIRNNIRVQEALQEQRLAEYELAVVSAVKEVKDALVDYRKEQERYVSLAEAVDAAQAAVDVARNQYTNGLTDFNNVLDAQRSLLRFQEEQVNSEGSVSLNAIRIYKALGGGWSQMPEQED